MKMKLKRMLKNIVLPLSQRQALAGELVTTPAAPRLEAPSGCFAGGYETAAVRWKSLLMVALCAVGLAAGAAENGWNELQAALTNSAAASLTSETLEHRFENGTNFVKLLKDVKADVSADTNLLVKAGSIAVLDLNGKTIDRGLGKENEAEEGEVILVDGGDLTVTDMSAAHDGKITGGHSSGDEYCCVGGVLVRKSARFTLLDGWICGNRGGASAGGVCVDNCSCFIMMGGHITDNEAMFCGGISVSSTEGDERPSTIELCGGEISGNGGMLIGGVGDAGDSRDEIRISGTVVITNNFGMGGTLLYAGGVALTGAGGIVFGGTPVIADNAVGSMTGAANVFVIEGTEPPATISEDEPLVEGADIHIAAMYEGDDLPVPASAEHPVKIVEDCSAADAKFFTSEIAGTTVYFGDGGLWVGVPKPVKVEALSNKFAMDLTPGDRIAQAEETLVVDPAWGKAETATVELHNGWTRTYTCASNDLWDTTELVNPGRYNLAFHAEGLGDIYKASFWKTGDDWVVFDGSNITEGVTFEPGKTYLFFGTNTVSGATLTVKDGAKFLYDGSAPAGFLGGTVDLPKRYGKVVDGDLYQIVEKIKGSEDNPWEVGGTDGTDDLVTGWTNGTELVIGGTGAVTNLADVAKGGIAAVKITDATVTGAGENAFAGVGGGNAVKVSLPDGWQGELPKDGELYGMKVDMASFTYPTAVRNVTFLQRYPWNGLVDVSCDLTGSGAVTLKVTVLTNGVTFVENPTVDGKATVDLDAVGGVMEGAKLVWNAAKDLPAGFKAQNVKAKVTVEK